MTVIMQNAGIKKACYKYKDPAPELNNEEFKSAHGSDKQTFAYLKYLVNLPMEKKLRNNPDLLEEKENLTFCWKTSIKKALHGDKIPSRLLTRIMCSTKTLIALGIDMEKINPEKLGYGTSKLYMIIYEI